MNIHTGINTFRQTDCEAVTDKLLLSFFFYFCLFEQLSDRKCVWIISRMAEFLTFDYTMAEVQNNLVLLSFLWSNIDSLWQDSWGWF